MVEYGIPPTDVLYLGSNLGNAIESPVKYSNTEFELYVANSNRISAELSFKLSFFKTLLCLILISTVAVVGSWTLLPPSKVPKPLSNLTNPNGTDKPTCGPSPNPIQNRKHTPARTPTNNYTGGCGGRDRHKFTRPKTFMTRDFYCKQDLRTSSVKMEVLKKRFYREMAAEWDNSGQINLLQKKHSLNEKSCLNKDLSEVI
jgi:hypothetical protein